MPSSDRPGTGLDIGDALEHILTTGAPALSSTTSTLKGYAEKGAAVLTALLDACQGASVDDIRTALADVTRNADTRLHIGVLLTGDKYALPQLEADLRAAGARAGDVSGLAKRLRAARDEAAEAIAQDQVRRERAKTKGQGTSGYQLQVIEGEMENDVMVAAVGKELAAHPEVFVRGGAYVVVKDPPTAPTKEPLPPEVVPLKRGQAARCIVQRVRYLRSDEGPIMPPPKWVTESILDEANPQGRPLEAIVSCPTLRPDGTVLDAPGYDPAIGVLYAPQGDPLRLDIPEAPTWNDAAAAAEDLMDLVGDFAFDSPESASVWLALVLTLAGRYAFEGNVPMTVVEATTRGSGKSLLLDLAGQITTGRSMPRLELRNQAGDDEMAKVITGQFISGDTLLMIDNLNAPLGGANLDILLTAPTWKGRQLGTSRVFTFRNDMITCVSANNFQIAEKSDLSRRLIISRLAPNVEDPEKRNDFRIPHIEAHVKRHQARYLGAALTVLRAYMRQDCPPPKGGRPRFGSFQVWSDLVRCAILWLGYADPVVIREDLDPAAMNLRRFMGLWVDCFGLGNALPLREVRRRFTDRRAAIEDNEDLFAWWTLAGELNLLKGDAPDTGRLGRYLRDNRGRVLGGLRIGARQEGKKAAEWWVERGG